jgi:coproporphyrinogen III oxidase-like Fe-S oxidoreductase
MTAPIRAGYVHAPFCCSLCRHCDLDSVGPEPATVTLEIAEVLAGPGADGTL